MEKLSIADKDSQTYFLAISAQAWIANHTNDKEEALYHFRRSFPHAETAEDSLALLTLYGNIIDQDNVEKADSIYLEAEKVIKRVADPKAAIKVYFSLANTKLAKGEFEKALDYNFKVLDIEDINLYQKANAYRKIARIFLIMGNTELTKQYIDLAIEIEEERKFKSRYELSSLIQSQMLLDLNEVQAAEEEAKNAQAFFKNSRNFLGKSGNYNSLTSVDIKKKDWESARENLKQTFHYKDSISEMGIVFYIPLLMNKCELLLHDKAFNAVISVVDEIIELSKDFDSPIYKKQALGYKQKALDGMGNIEEAYQVLNTIQTIEDTLFKKDKIFMANYLETQFNRKEQENAIALLDTKNELQTNQLSQQRKMLVITGLAFLIVSLLSFFLFRLFKKVASQKMLLSKALGEKDTLLREIHHRVKNNLQLVSSLLGLQSQHIQDPNALNALNSGKARVKSMALIHQDLYNKENLTGVSVREYLEKLSIELLGTYQFDKEKVDLKIDISEMLLDVDTLIPLGLILNELLTNSLKYAFPNNRSGKIEIKVYEDAAGLKLEFLDDGVGIDLNKKTASSFGYKLIDTLLDQLEGEMEIRNDSGTQLYFTFTDYKIAA